MNSAKKLLFLEDIESNQAKEFGIFLLKLDENFIAKSPEAETELKNLVAGICEYSYKMTQSCFDLALINQGLQVKCA